MEGGRTLGGAMRATPATTGSLGRLFRAARPCPQLKGARGPGRSRPVHRAAEPQRFADFLNAEPAPPPSEMTAEEKAQELIDRTAEVLAATRAALEDVRRRDPADSGNRLPAGGSVTSGPTVVTTSAQAKVGAAPAAAAPATRPAARSSPFLAWQSDGDDDEEEEALASASHRRGGGGPAAGLAPGGGGGGGGGAGRAPVQGPAGVDSWFGDKVDTGAVGLRAAALKPSARSTAPVMDRPIVPASLEFAAPAAPAESGADTIFPDGFALRFQSDAPQGAAPAAAPAQPEGDWERTSGEEFGPNGYWYRWSEVQGRDASGAVAWSERWWEASDWRGMREMGAEKWGSNARGDAWRETWREAIGFDAHSGQPIVERSAHKWARNARAQEWEEKWGESYWSAGRAEKFADKWARDGGDVWHEKWGESYDGQGGCVKYTDRWAERPPEDGSPGLRKWGDKWEERFKDGRGSKSGETWSEGAGGEKYNRWWGENHWGDGRVQKHGHSTEGEHWDSTEWMDTYYNPIPHFGYDLALAHSPQLRNVPTVPRDELLEGGGGGAGGL